jgi:hypothetical protein
MIVVRVICLRVFPWGNRAMNTGESFEAPLANVEEFIESGWLRVDKRTQV